MSETSDPFDWGKYEELMAESMAWANLEASIQRIADDNKALVRDLSGYDPSTAIPLLASLLTLPEYQSHCIRLETLTCLAVLHCKGRKKAQIGQAVRWFYQIGKSRCVLGEDAAEDVFVGLVVDPSGGDYRILEGVWEASGFYTQRVIEVVNSIPDTGYFGQIKHCFRAILKISDIVCERSGLHRYQLGSDERHSALSPKKLPKKNALTSRVRITFEELDALGIGPAEVNPFILGADGRADMLEQEIGSSALDRCPLLVLDNESLIVALPSALSTAARNYVIENIFEGALVSSFDDMLAKDFSVCLSETPLLGGPLRAPVHWKKVGHHRCSTFFFKVDEGYVISFHLFLPSISIHSDGSFKSFVEDDGELTAAVQETIDGVVKHCDGQEDFKEGVVVVAGCGWGKGYATKQIRLDHPKWRVQMMSVADLVRASWLSNMNPLFFWQLQDGFEAITKAGVHIQNINGILNLIGWVRSNDGHFVPHAQLPEGEISPDRPLMVQPPMNLLRDVRAQSDHGFDRHSLVDNNGVWHDIQHASSDPFFSSESSRRIYASTNEVRKGHLTAVYEGAQNYWVTVSAPNVPERDIEFRLWEMLKEWLHRVGRVIDDQVPAVETGQSLRVYAEFLHSEPPDDVAEKPTVDALEKLCRLDVHEESSAIKIVFDTGFLDGFRIAENVAERIAARSLTRAYLTLLGSDDPEHTAKELEALIVPNDQARSFHFFHARKFLDFTRQKLPKELISINLLDDAAAKIGLGWRVLGRDGGNQVSGRNECTKFLNEIVDVLLAEVFETLSRLERTAAIKRFVENVEKASSDGDHWTRTSAALLGLHGDQPDTIKRCVEQISKFNGASIASRVLTEIAVCVCPLEEGAYLSDIELSKLLARIALIVRLGGLSDAIRFNALSPELTISPLGDILFRDDFGENVVEPMLSQHAGDKMVARAPQQKANYEEPEVVAKVKGKISDEFWGIWEKEMGFDIDQARVIMDALDDEGIREEEPLYFAKKSEILELLGKRGIPEDIAQMFLDRFSLWPRARWDKPPKGYKMREIYPWRFGRRLSFVTRPIVRLDEAEDPTYLIAPNAVRTGFTYVLDCAFRGHLDQDFFQSKEMRDDWWGKASEGHSFNSDVAKTLEEEGWTVRENIGLPEVLNQRLDRDYGDIDVLAWRADRVDVLVVESKDLSLARNYSEVAALLADYQGGERNGKADKLRRHLDRVELVVGNLWRLSKFTDVAEPKVSSWLVCSGIVPMQYAAIEALKHTSVGSIDDLKTF